MPKTTIKPQFGNLDQIRLIELEAKYLNMEVGSDKEVMPEITDDVLESASV